MREIKYRAWDKERKEWQYFTLHQLIRGEASRFYTQLENWCEWTGLLDKDGKDIYEGDVVRYHHYYNNFGTVEEDEYRNGRVEWNNQPMHGGWKVIERKVYENGYINENHEERFPNYNDYKGQPILSIEIIGNRFENPELLKK